MFFCPNCDNSFDITRSVVQKGGAPDETSESMSESSDIYSTVINKIISHEQVTEEEIENIAPQTLFKSQAFKKLKSKQKELVYNQIQDLLPKQKKKIIREDEDKPLEENLAFFICNGCGFTKRIQPQTLIFSRTSESIAQSYVAGDYSDMLHSDILPRTRKYTCINDDCPSHKDAKKREASFFRLNNSYKVRYICHACGSDF